MLHNSFILIFLLMCVFGTHASSVCKEDETEVTTPYYFKDNVPDSFCADLFASAVPDYYNEDYRNECKLQMGLDATPHSVTYIQSARCIRKTNGTATYRMKLCCPGVTTNVVCYTCTNVTATRDHAFNEYHTQNCNVLGQDAVDPVTCPAGQVCYTRVGTYRKVTKGCMSATTCSTMESNNYSGDYTCKNYINDPHCVYCCGDTDNGICNADMPTSIPYLRPPTTDNGDPCDPNPCYYGGTCTRDSNNTYGYQCACKLPYSGYKCQYTPCSYSPCKNGAQCMIELSEPPFYYRCACRLPYDRQNCTTDARNCSDEDATNCKQGSTCYLLENGVWSCLCAAGFVGTRCDQPVKKCLPNNGMLWSFDRTLNNVVSTKTCQEAYDTDYLYSRYSTSSYYLDRCRSYMDSWYPGSRYVDGVHGIPVYSNMQVEMVSCEKAEEPSRSWVTVEFCCNPCLSNPCSSHGYCLEVNGEAVCRCRHGYGGKTCGSRLAKCYVSGDPHYITFDGERFSAQGTCLYKLTENQSPETNGVPYFAVYNKNEHRGQSTSVSYPSYIEVVVYNHTVRIARQMETTVDGEPVDINSGYTDPSNLFQVEKNGQYATLSVDFGLTVTYDGNWMMSVSVPEAVSGQVDGMCRDYNGDEEDDYTVDGQDYSNDPARDSLIGTMFQVNDPDNTECYTPITPDMQECTGGLLAQIESDKYCGTIRNSSQSSIFHHCYLSEKEVRMRFEDCVYDVCAVTPDQDVMKETACNSLTAVVEACKDNEKHPALNWRELSKCMISCPNNRTYKPNDDACLPTCKKPDPSKTCIYPKTETCSCKDDNYVVNSAGECVPAQSCGCKHGGEHREIGESWISNDCSVKFSCQECTTCARPVGEVVTETAGCDDEQICTSGICHDIVTTAPGPACYDCETNNPCLDGNVGDLFCFVGGADSYLQCGPAATCNKMLCPQGLVWDEELGICGWPKEPIQEPTPNTHTQQQEPTPTGGMTCPNDCENNNPCADHSGGFFCSSNGAGHYIQCGMAGLCYKMVCAPGLVWNSASNVCDWP